jgi:hypothetical protein
VTVATWSRGEDGGGRLEAGEEQHNVAFHLNNSNSWATRFMASRVGGEVHARADDDEDARFRSPPRLLHLLQLLLFPLSLFFRLGGGGGCGWGLP